MCKNLGVMSQATFQSLVFNEYRRLGGNRITFQNLKGIVHLTDEKRNTITPVKYTFEQKETKN